MVELLKTYVFHVGTLFIRVAWSTIAQRTRPSSSRSQIDLGGKTPASSEILSQDNYTCVSQVKIGEIKIMGILK